MPIKGTLYWNDPNRVYRQANNPAEELLKKRGVGNWTESCGNTSATSIIDTMGKLVEIKMPGGYLPQPEQQLFDYFNDPNNYAKFRAVRSDINPVTMLNNEVPQFYTIACKEVFGVVCEFQWATDTPFDSVAKFVSDGNGVQICLINPGHFLGVVSYDSDKDELIYNDSYAERFNDGTNGFNRRMTRAEFTSNVAPWWNVFWK